MKNKLLTSAIILSICHISAMEQPDHKPNNSSAGTQKDILTHVSTETGCDANENVTHLEETKLFWRTIDYQKQNDGFAIKELDRGKGYDIPMGLKLENYKVEDLIQITNSPNASQIVALDLSRFVVDQSDVVFHPRDTFQLPALKETLKLLSLEELNLSGNYIHYSVINYLNKEMPEKSFLKLKKLNLSNTNCKGNDAQDFRAAFEKAGNKEIIIIT